MNERYVDLHTHSSASDGTLSPAALLERAAARGLAAVALTDHDTVAGLAEFQEAACRHPEIRAVNGVELGTRYGGREIHVVGLFVDPENSELSAFLAAARADRQSRGRRMCEKLAELGYALSDEELCAAGANASFGRPHLARALMLKYGFSAPQEVFERLLKPGRPGYVPRALLPPEAAIQAIHAAGGVSVWAHPLYRQGGANNKARGFVERFSRLGLDAVEAYYSEFDAGQTEFMLTLAEKYALAVSGGSDFHGANHPDIELGTGRGMLAVPESVLAGLEKKRGPKLIVV